VIAGKYHLGRVLGEGGMGSVYEADHRELGAKVAVKLLAEANLTQHKSLTRFRREAKVMAAIRHENVVSVMDAGTDEEGIPFLVMELLDGESLASKLRRERVLTPALASWISCEILSGLGAAHAAGVIHRDLKPGNVFICKQTDGSYRVKLLDFGISKLGDASETLDVTADGALVGTPNFMAPEQVYANVPIDGRVDIYAAGVILYRMVTGTLPYVGKTTEELYRKILDARAFPPRQVRADIPQELEDIIMRAMHPDRDQRFPDAASFREALERVMPDSALALSGRPQRPGRSERSQPLPRAEVHGLAHAPTGPAQVSTAPQRPAAHGPVFPHHGAHKRRTWPWIAALVIALGAIVGAVVTYSITRESRKQNKQQAVAPTVRPLGEPIRFGIFRHKDPDDIKREMQPLVSYLETELSRPVELVIVDNYRDLGDSLLEGKVDLAALSAYSYIRAKRKLDSLRLLATPATPTGPTYGGYILARTNSGITELNDLKGKVFCYVSQNSTSGYLYPRALLRQHGIDPDKDFSATRFTSDHAASLQTLADGACDGAAVYDKAWLESNKLDRSAFTVVGTIEPVPWDAYCTTDALDKEVIEKLRTALQALAPDSPRAREVFADDTSPFKGFIPGDDSLYDPVRSLEQYLDQSE
jgi:serine/threonine-protein kinase